MSGTLKDGNEAVMRFSLNSEQRVWQQRGLTKSAKHLHRDYVNRETFEDILVHWVPCDWRRVANMEEHTEEELSSEL